MPVTSKMSHQNIKRTNHYITDMFDNIILSPVMDLPEPDVWITLYSSTGVKLAEYEVSLAGLTDALTDAVATNIVEIPICMITGDAEVPMGVKLMGVSRLSSVLVGTVTLNDQSVLENLTVSLTGSDAGEVVGVYGPDTGYNLVDPLIPSLAQLYSVTVTVENNIGPAYAVQLTCGGLSAHDTELLALVGSFGYSAFVTYGAFTHHSGRAVGTDPDGAYFLDV